MSKLELIEKCKELTKDYKNKSEFKKKNPGLYKKCCYDKIIDDIFGDNYDRTKNHYKNLSIEYTLDKIKEICKTVTRTEFSYNYQFLKLMLKNYYNIDYKILEYKSKNKRIFIPKYSEEHIIEIVKNMKFRSELEIYDKKVYMFCKNKGYFKTICKHLKISSISRPQLIMTYILNHIFKMYGNINDRNIIKPYEIDLYYQCYKLGFEYNGKKWHINNKNDILKQKNAKNNGILLLIINDNNKNDYESDIKKQICNKLLLINKHCNIYITKDDINKIKVDYDNIISYNVESYIEVIKKYSNLRDFAKNDYSVYNNLKCLGLLYKLAKDIRTLNTKELLQYSYELSSKYSDFNEFKKLHKRRFYNIYKTGDYKYINYYHDYKYIKNEDIILHNKSIFYIKNNNLKLYKHIIRYRKELLDIIPKYDDKSIVELVKNYDNYLLFKKENKDIFIELSDIHLNLIYSYFKSINYNKYFSLDINLYEIKEICLKYTTISRFGHEYPKLIKYLRKEQLIDNVFEHLVIKSRNNTIRNREIIVRTKY